MRRMPVITKFSENKLNEILNEFTSIKFLSKEIRKDFSSEFPIHTRYFSNGDIPLVALINVSGKAVFGYDNKLAHLSDGEFVFFDDSKPHSWIFKNSDLEIFYYRLFDIEGTQITQGDYCLDNYF